MEGRALYRAVSAEFLAKFLFAFVCVGCALGYLDFRFPEIDWRADHPNLARLFEKLAQRPGFADTAPPKA